MKITCTCKGTFPKRKVQNMTFFLIHVKFLKLSRFFFFFVQGILIDKCSISYDHIVYSCSSFTCLRKFPLTYYLSPARECQLPDSKDASPLCTSRLGPRGNAWHITRVPGTQWAQYFLNHYILKATRLSKITSKYKWIEDLIILWTLSLILLCLVFIATIYFPIFLIE